MHNPSDTASQRLYRIFGATLLAELRDRQKPPHGRRSESPVGRGRRRGASRGHSESAGVPSWLVGLADRGGKDSAGPEAGPPMLPPLNSDQRSKRARLAAKRRHHPTDTATLEAQRDFRAERAEDYIRRLVDEAPPLTEEQRARLAALLRPTQVGEAA